MSKKPGKLIVISGPSGAGKTTLVAELDMKRAVTATTRPMRHGEKDKVDYHFYTKEHFEELIDLDAFFEWAEYNDHLYGLPKGPVYNAISNGETLVAILDVQGAESVRKAGVPHVSIFVKAPTMAELRRRMQKLDRNNVENRLEIAEEELKHQDRFDHVLVCDGIKKTLPKLIEIIKEG